VALVAGAGDVAVVVAGVVGDGFGGGECYDVALVESIAAQCSNLKTIPRPS